MELTQETLAQLAEFFPAKHVSWKPQATKGSKALAVAYIDARVVSRRLDEVVGGDWEFHWAPDGDNVRGSLTVCGSTREDVGEQGDGPQGKTRKAAVSDALKRCAAHFGIGRYLYFLDPQWVDFDPQSKRLVREPELPAWALPTNGAPDKLTDKKPLDLEEGNDEGEKQAPLTWEHDPLMGVGKAAEFLIKACQHYGLADKQVLEALGVDSIVSVVGTMAEAKAKIEAWVTAQTEA